MLIKANELKVGHVIRLEYGDYENFVNFKVTEVFQTEKEISISAESQIEDRTFSFCPESLVYIVS